ncbi:glucose-6-phosphate isomerase [Polynucleobacter sp. MWH-Spelu-300-X4]|uniref:glucose-6-phosphate isomerase n=1 Tax=Polynucleobacter sp. MWH-Spelu-300-X4 TaxID=2689109 RepID=UPI001BFDAC40|nr:glucose-6-phosphate isomerase [Polynucleobacter sp. MWH-Spelu-300-X4]QWD79348.1 glucose-6-phosphate isomerase [Polynucleobacter sp. MWH-Spelu-300-X4]
MSKLISAVGLTLDTAYQKISDDEWRQLIDMAIGRGALKKRDDLLAGKAINQSENRAALHPALRNLSNRAMTIDGIDVMPLVKNVWQRMSGFCNQLMGITDIICLGIGGSDWGPRLVCDALYHINPKENNAIRLHFVANIDSAELATALSRAQPHSTRVLITSKTFTTLETLRNAQTVINWLKQHNATPSQIKKSLIGITANPEAAEAFGIAPDNIYPFWDWVGGRFSVWSAVGFPIAIKFGFDTYMDFLAGAHAMDEHFITAPATENMPLTLALTLIHNQKKHGITAKALIPYAHALRLLPEWLQQLEMESHGKTVTMSGETCDPTSPVVFGSAGSNSQHSYFQMLHQGSQIIPVDFIAVQEPMSQLPEAKEHHEALIANCLAQAQALANGSNETNAYNSCPGNRPSNLLWVKKLDAYHLGALLALYEHRALCLGAIWNLNSFDQPGVELGKKLAKPIQQALHGDNSALNGIDEITAARIKWLNS